MNIAGLSAAIAPMLGSTPQAGEPAGKAAITSAIGGKAHSDRIIITH